MTAAVVVHDKNCPCRCRNFDSVHSCIAPKIEHTHLLHLNTCNPSPTPRPLLEPGAMIVTMGDVDGVDRDAVGKVDNPLADVFDNGKVMCSWVAVKETTLPG